MGGGDYIPRTPTHPLSPMTTPERNNKRKAAAVQQGHVVDDVPPPPARAGAYWSEDVWGRRLTCPITHQLFADPVMASDGTLTRYLLGDAAKFPHIEPLS